MVHVQCKCSVSAMQVYEFLCHSLKYLLSFEVVLHNIFFILYFFFLEHSFLCFMGLFFGLPVPNEPPVYK